MSLASSACLLPGRDLEVWLRPRSNLLPREARDFGLPTLEADSWRCTADGED
eukprot:CAMPEP_0206496306 /NCGR_PEP_ID=MMETSP0324_2-20121206/49294_1 /ASSEMBLY_ACC=CAM_ASM_000836 /TAXON_ID=2866 /ORGANISM="Crypthecodinium cohnii, Strain Seligo" /LENGTH=51 /DNA_ID=CAMNT_0053981225 /DNA_START=363 /DNA_END=515 /DNA_ORIENTATION=+